MPLVSTWRGSDKVNDVNGAGNWPLFNTYRVLLAVRRSTRPFRRYVISGREEQRRPLTDD